MMVFRSLGQSSERAAIDQARFWTGQEFYPSLGNYAKRRNNILKQFAFNQSVRIINAAAKIRSMKS